MATTISPLTITHPHLAALADGWNPSEVSFRSYETRKWRCEFGHTWETTARIISRWPGCPECHSDEIIEGYNDLSVTHPWLYATMQESPYQPRRNLVAVGADSDEVFMWTCDEWHTWITRVKTRVARDHEGCPVCAGRISGFNNRWVHAESMWMLSEAHGWNPHNYTYLSNKVVDWKCDKGHIWRMAISKRVKSNAKCPYCTNRLVLTDYNDLATTHPAIGEQAFGWDPRKVTHSSKRERDWICEEGHVWSTSPNSRKKATCPFHDRGGYNIHKDGWIYLLEHGVWGLLQIGISNHIEQRLRDHEKIGWRVIEIDGPMNGKTAYRLEQKILKSLKKRGITLGQISVSGKFSGFTESWPKDELYVKTLYELATYAAPEEFTLVP